MKLYLSGPMTGYPEGNYEEFRAMSARLRFKGHEVLDPSENFEGKQVGEEGITREDCMREDINNVLRADAVAVMRGWQKSKGARLEVSIAREVGIPVLSADTLEPEDEFIGDPRFHKLLEQIGELHDKKQADYGRKADPFANVRGSVDWGVSPWVGAMIRANDKIKRLQQFARTGTLKNEGVEDSFMDLAVYALIGMVLYQEDTNEKPTG